MERRGGTEERGKGERRKWCGIEGGGEEEGERKGEGEQGVSLFSLYHKYHQVWNMCAWPATFLTELRSVWTKSLLKGRLNFVNFRNSNRNRIRQRVLQDYLKVTCWLVRVKSNDRSSAFGQDFAKTWLKLVKAHRFLSTQFDGVNQNSFEIERYCYCSAAAPAINASTSSGNFDVENSPL